MFTNEIKYNSTVTTVLDEEATFEDVILEITDDIVYIKQWNDTTFDDVPDYITMSPKMFKDLLEALKKPEGLFKTEYINDSILDSI